jgi:RNA polymerase subunit RPABC4/transcription elongation factor Spt4
MSDTKQTKSADEKYCSECGEIIRLKAEICPHCGVRQAPVAGQLSGIPNHRHCNACGHTGVMKTWLRNYNMPQFVAIVGLLFWVLPGLIFIAWAWGKYRCPSCGKVGESSPA